MSNDPRQQIVMTDEMVKAGIMPWGTGVRNMAEVLSRFPEEEARKLKRKYRKVWRNEVKKKLAHLQGQLAKELNPQRKKLYEQEIESIKARYGIGNPKPSRAQRVKRRQDVGQVFDQKARARIIEEEQAAKPQAGTTKRARKR